MKRSGLILCIRRQDYYRPMLRVLADLGVTRFDIVAPTGRGHPILTFNNGVHDVRIPLPSSPAGGKARQYLTTEIRRAVRKGQAAGDPT